MTARSRVLWYLILPILLLVACVVQPVPAVAQMTSVGIDCSQVQELGLLKQENMRAGLALIECGIVQGGHPSAPHAVPPAPPNIRVSNRACTSSASCTKSESMVTGSTKNKGKTIVVNFNDSAGDGSTYSGASYSTDGGTTFHEISPRPFENGHGFNLGDPIVIFNSKLNKWFAGDLAGCSGGQGIGLWSSTNGKTWTPTNCPDNGTSDDRESMWVDNNPTSGTYGRMYISFNNFANDGGALTVTYS